MKLDVYKCMSCALILSLFVVIRETSAIELRDRFNSIHISINFFKTTLC